MRILELNLMAFGPFEDLSIDLSRGNHGLHIIYGPNEAGKSSALRALQQVFYGIPVRSEDNFRFSHNKLRIGATICNNDGNILEFIRRKGKSKTLRAPDDNTVLEDTILTPFLNGVDADLFSTMFGIDHSDLVKGGKEIISGGGNLGQLIFAAGSGITNLRDIHAEFQNNADTLFKPAGKLPLINDIIRRIKENRKLIRDSQLASGVWEKHDQALQAALESKKEIEVQLAAARSEKNHMERIKNSLPIISQRNELLESLKPYISAILLPENFSKQRREHLSDFKIAENDQAHTTERIKQLEKERNRLKVSPLILQYADTIESLYRDLGGFGKAAKDRLQLHTRREMLHTEAKQILQTLREDLTIDDSDQVRLNKQQTMLIQEMGSRYERIIALIETNTNDIPSLTSEIHNINTRLSEMQNPRSTDELHHAIEQAVEYAPLEKQHLEELAEIELAESLLENELASQTYWNGSIRELERLKIPSLETVDVFENEFETANHFIQSKKNEIQQHGTDLTETIRKKEELNLNFTVPTESDLIQARKNRDSGWRIIASEIDQETATEKNKNINEFLQKYPQAENLRMAYEHSVVYADEISDRLRREADRVSTLAKLLSDKKDLEKKLTDQKKSLATQVNACEQLSERWNQQWSSAAISPASPKEMRAWIVKKNDITARFMEIRRRKSKSEILKAGIDDLMQKMSQSFTSLAGPPAAPYETLMDLVKRGKRIIKKENDLTEKRKTLENDKFQKQLLLAELKSKTEINEKELARWKQGWKQAVSPLGLDENALPAHAGSLIDEFKVFFDKLKEAGVIQKRISGIDRDAAAFQSRAFELIRIVANDLSGLPVEQAVMNLIACLKQSQTADSKKQTLEKQIDQANIHKNEAAKKITDTQIFLNAMCEEARCENYLELSNAERRSDIRRELESELNVLDSQLLKLSAGASIENFITESLAIEADSIDSRIDTLSENINILTNQKSTLDQAIGSERTELSKMNGSARAAVLAEETQTLLGSLEENVETYIRYKLAAAVLNQSIEKFRDKNQSPVLKKASAFFSKITGGSFEGIRAEFDDTGNPVIVGIRNGVNEIVHVSGMSEGTADQLYLSLRLAGLKTFLEKNDPIPFIVDDILIKFDNTRAIATLNALADLSDNTQIIFFTHNQHLVDLAKKNVDTTRLITHSLSS